MNIRLKKIKILFGIMAYAMIQMTSNAATSASDNDGSAFITKAEFDALKSSFQSIIDTYNNAIDSKIDSAIASYLSGIRLSKTSTKKVLLPNYKGVAMYENSDLAYYYARPDFHCYLIGMQATFTTTKLDTSSGWTQLTGFFNAKIDYEHSPTDTFGRELSVIKNSVASPKYIWQGYDTNVKRTITVTQLMSKIPTDSAYHQISWTNLSMSLNDAWTAPTKETNINNKSLIEGAIWSYRVSTTLKDNGYDFYGPCQYLSYTERKTNSIVLEYKPETRSDYLKWQNYYVISYTNSGKPCNLKNEVLQFNKPVTGATTETQKDFHNSLTVSGTEHLDWCGQEIYHHAISKYNLDATSPNSYMKVTGDVPVYGGLGIIDSNDIRQQENNIVSNEFPSIELSDLSLNDGFPLLIEEKDNEIKYSIEFNDTIGEYYKVWLSYKPFAGEPSDTGTNNVTFSDGKKYAIIKDGKGTLKWTMDDTSEVYLKWVRCDSSGTALSTNKDDGVLNLEKCGFYEVTKKDD